MTLLRLPGSRVANEGPVGSVKRCFGADEIRGDNRVCEPPMNSEDIPRSEGALESVERFQAILMGNWRTQVLYVAARLGLADLLAAGPRTSAELARATNTHPGALHRLLRALSTIDVCLERDDGSFELT